MRTSTTSPRTIRTVAIVGALGLSLAACGATDTDGANEAIRDNAADPTSETQPNDPEAATESGDAAQETPEETTEEPGQVSGGVTDTAVLAAVDTAENHLQGGVAYELNRNDDESYDIDVANEQQDMELVVSADGTEVTLVVDEDETDAEDWQQILELTVPMSEAIRTAQNELPGTVTEADVERDGSAFYWDVEIREEGSIWDVSVYVDATTGEVLQR